MKKLTEKYFLNRGFKKVAHNIYMIMHDNYENYGAFMENLSVRLLNDKHTWRLSIMPVDEYTSYEEIDLIEFCNPSVFEDFVGRLLIEFKS